MSESKATPRPWTKDGNGIHKGTSCVAVTYGDNKLADADLIVTAVNAHDDLLAACKAAYSLLRKLGGKNHDPEFTELAEAIKKAEGETK